MTSRGDRIRNSEQYKKQDPMERLNDGQATHAELSLLKVGKAGCEGVCAV